MAFCTHCGAQLPDGARFCQACGRAVGGEPGPGAPPPAGGGSAPPVPPDYPARLDIDYPDRPLNRVSTFFRIFTAIPIAIVLALLSGSGVGAGTLVLPVVLMLLFRRKYPGWWFDWNRELTRFSTRVTAYVALLDDRYPSTDDEQSVRLQLDAPDAQSLSRGLPLVKWFLAIPHYFVLLLLGIAAFFVIVFAWFAILFTGRYPRGAFNYVVGVMRWTLRVQAYAFLLITDRYPPFQLGP